MYVALGLARSVLMQPLNRAKVSVQRSTCKVFELMPTVAGLKEHVQTLRENADDSIKDLLKETGSMPLESLEPPRRRRPPARLTGPVAHFTPGTTEDWLRPEYLSFLDATSMELSERFEGECIKESQKFAKLLFTPRRQSSAP